MTAMDQDQRLWKFLIQLILLFAWNWIHGFIAHALGYIIHNLDQYLSNLIVLLIGAMIYYAICSIISNRMNKQNMES